MCMAKNHARRKKNTKSMQLLGVISYLQLHSILHAMIASAVSANATSLHDFVHMHTCRCTCTCMYLSPVVGQSPDPGLGDTSYAMNFLQCYNIPNLHTHCT